MLFEKLKRLAREPLIHFMLLGAGIYAVYGAFEGGEESAGERKVTVTAGDIQALSDQWMRLWNRRPTEDELAGVIRDHVRVQILHQEAVAMGLDVGDRVIERRLAQKLEMLAQGLITPDEPSEAELRAWYAANPDRFKQPDLYTVTQVFFDPDKRGEATLDDARATLEEFNALESPPSDYSGYGDRLMLQNHYPDVSELEFRRLFGSAFVEQIVELEPGIWHGPILSGYGTHLVMIGNVLRSPRPEFEEVRAQIEEAWMAERVSELSERFLESLMSRYEIVIEETEAPMTIPGKSSTP